ncbi:T9SS type B sorting domain-containing protein [Pedobacter sp. HMF7647]|uniref:T9SS type B sorting domain-containing protein n=1 Tax=Hufsiella arboris TaxID=2695275 RepID=A0A7K1Y8D2_9SPHI|nr:gliding motility-associated C-terminal domain-containing protein [Hufsiella arboris]MXV50836.1 T9SS type B sorting domain-containing protein [Hufsiella arboris]
MKKVSVVILLIYFAPIRLWAQFVNSGQQLTISDKGLVYIDDSYLHNSGSVTNNGSMVVKGNWTNNDHSSFVFNNVSKGAVFLNGGLQQIDGTDKTVFPSLDLSGYYFKKLLTDADVNGNLSLNDVEFKLEDRILTVLNNRPSAVSRTKGFISTDKGGMLNRSLTNTGQYLYPFGSSLHSGIYRPLEMILKNASGSNEGVVSATFYYDDPSNLGYSRNSKSEELRNMNIYDKYFYVLKQKSGYPLVNVRFYQGIEENLFPRLAKTPKGGLWSLATSDPHVLQNSAAEPFAKYLEYESLQPLDEAFTFTEAGSLIFYNAFSPDGDGKNDTWLIKNIDSYPDNEITIFNRWGNEIYKTKGYSSAKPWDGGAMMSGTYFYVLNVTMNGERRTFKGFITMIKKD